MALYTFLCPQCRGDVFVPRVAIGQHGKCPNCGAMVLVPSPEKNAEFPQQQADERGARLVAAAAAQLDQYVLNPGNLSADQALRGRLFSTMSTVLGILLAICIGAFVVGMSMGDAAFPLAVFGITFGFILCIVFPISWVHDYQASHIHDAPTPDKAFRRYFKACQSGRYEKAFASLAPAARNGALVHALKFEKIPSESRDCKITDWMSFRDYSRSIFKGPHGQQRGANLKKVEVEGHLPDGTTWVTADVQFTSQPTWAILLLPVVFIVGRSVFDWVTQRERKTIRKCLFRRGDRWYVAEADFEGVLDKL